MALHTHASVRADRLEADYPWTTIPLITCAPMRLIAHASLALAVSRSQGLGFLGVGTEASLLSFLLKEAKASLQSSPIPRVPPGILPFGVGFICWGADLSTVCQVIKEEPLKPAAAWLFAPKEEDDLIAWVSGIRKASEGKTKIWIQVGSVTMAISAAKSCRPDVLVVQGSDAGGHGLARSSSIISLLPECVDALAKEGFWNIPLIATGGIVDGRGFAAALTLGASGISMGTRFLASPEADISNGYRNAIIRGHDGGLSTARTLVYDKLRGTTGWPMIYNGRALLNQSFWDDENGIDEAENKRLYNEALKLGDAGWGENGRVTAYAGTGVGLISSIKPAGDIVRELREDHRRILDRADGSKL